MNSQDGRKDPGPCERRVDGDRVTEMVPAGEWLTQAKKNGIILDPDCIYPPRLPRHSERDHLHENTREHAVFDPANPGLTTYVRVTRRINTDHSEEDKLQQARRDATKRDLAWEAKDQAEKNEILELRSLGLRSAMKAAGVAERNENDGGRAHTHGKVSKKSMLPHPPGSDPHEQL